MPKIIMPTEETKNFLEVFEMFVISQSAKGVADVTIRNYRHHMKNIGNYMDVHRPFDDVTKRDIESMAAAMRRSEMAHNSIATYMRMLRTFYNWCNAEGFSTLAVPAFKEKEAVKDTYTDAELALLLKRPAKDCDFGEFRSWVVVNFLMNSGCRSATVRCIQNQDVDLAALRVTYRHNKNSRIQVIPRCSMMANILREYMRIRKGAPEDYLFCDVYGGQLAEDVLLICRIISTDTKLISDPVFYCGGAENLRLRQTTFSPLTFYSYYTKNLGFSQIMKPVKFAVVAVWV